jgi:arsenate reductase-like glutaredoxin family protein
MHIAIDVKVQSSVLMRTFRQRGGDFTLKFNQALKVVARLDDLITERPDLIRRFDIWLGDMQRRVETSVAILQGQTKRLESEAMGTIYELEPGAGYSFKVQVFGPVAYRYLALLAKLDQAFLAVDRIYLSGQMKRDMMKNAQTQITATLDKMVNRTNTLYQQSKKRSGGLYDPKEFQNMLLETTLRELAGTDSDISAKSGKESQEAA